MLDFSFVTRVIFVLWRDILLRVFNIFVEIVVVSRLQGGVTHDRIFHGLILWLRLYIFVVEMCMARCLQTTHLISD